MTVVPARSVSGSRRHPHSHTGTLPAIPSIWILSCHLPSLTMVRRNAVPFSTAGTLNLPLNSWMYSSRKNLLAPRAPAPVWPPLMPLRDQSSSLQRLLHPCVAQLDVMLLLELLVKMPNVQRS